MFNIKDPAKMTPAFTEEHAKAGFREGWLISQCFGSEYGEWQVQKIDDPADRADEFGEGIAELPDDNAAMLMVRTGTGEHHAAARAFIQAHNPIEWEFLQKVTAAVVAE